MNPLTVNDFIGISANIIALGVALGLLFATLVQPRRERANWWFAAFLLTLAVWGYCGIVLTLPQMQGVITARTGLHLYIGSLGLIPITFFFAAMAFCEISTTLTRGIALITGPVIAAAFVLLWSDQLYTVDAGLLAQPVTFRILLSTLTIQPAGVLALGLGAGYLVITLALLRQARSPRSKTLLLPTVLLFVGLISSLAASLYALPVDITLVTAAAALVGIALLRQQIFDPLQQMNLKLTHTNTELRQTITELTAAQERATLLNEELRTVSQYKSEFLATMSHELRTPLNSIVGYSELLSQGLYGSLNERQDDRVAKILRNSRDLLALINDILDLSRIETGRLALDLEQSSLNDVVEKVLANMRPLAEEKGLAVTTHYATGLPPIYADTLRLHQIVSNLVSNAIKFTPTGEITIAVRSITVQDGTSQTQTLPLTGWLKNGEWVLLTVQDTGIGIAPENHARIFDEFRQLDSTSTREFGGTGLGLAITRKLVNMHNGSIWVGSIPGKGSTFYVALPVSDVPAASPPAIPPAADSAETVHILCIDDNPEARDILASFLAEDGYRVTLASSGRQGIELARQLRPDVITTDLMMPGMTGWDVVNQLKASPQTASIPIVVISIVDQQPTGYEPTVAAHLSKPFTREALFSTLSEVLQPARQPHPILIVDDDVRTRRLVADILTSAGHETVTCTNGQEALHWLETHRPRIVLLDLMMPGINGFEVLANIRLRPDLVNVPVLVLSAKTLTEEEQAQLDRQRATLVRKQGLQRGILLQQIEQAES
ncbi:MAG: response regulator [Anaerolineae bacterium]|nr:response regulator [Anaerolineae bacterium]